MILLENIPEGVVLERQPTQWRLVLHNRSSKHVWNLLFHCSGVFYLLGAEYYVLEGAFQNRAIDVQGWLLGMLYVVQGILFCWLLAEILRSIYRLLQQQVNTLTVCLEKEGFSLEMAYALNRPALREYKRQSITAIYVNRGTKRWGDDVRAGMLNLPQQLFVQCQGQPPEAWGFFLREEQTEFLNHLLQEIYLQGKAYEHLFTEIGGQTPPRDSTF